MCQYLVINIKSHRSTERHAQIVAQQQPVYLLAGGIKTQHLENQSQHRKAWFVEDVSTPGFNTQSAAGFLEISTTILSVIC